MSIRKSRLTVKRVKAALQGAAGIRAVAARNLGVDRSTLYRFICQHPGLTEELEDIEEELKDLAEGKILQLIRAGDGQTVRWYMEMKGKDRGYTRRVENVGRDGGPIETTTTVDLSALTDEQLRQLQDLMILAGAVDDHQHGIHSTTNPSPGCACGTCAEGRRRAKLLASQSRPKTLPALMARRSR